MGTIVQANSSLIYIKKESTWGTAATSNYATMRFNRADLRQVTGTTVSEELTTSREPANVVRNQVTAEGSVDWEMMIPSTTAPATYLFEGLLGSTWTQFTTASQALDVTTVSAGNTCHWVAVTSGVFTGISAGDWVRSSGFVNTANNGYFYVSAVTSSTDITVKNPSAVAETTATSVDVNGTRLTMGTTLISYSMEQKIAAVEPLYHLYTGMVPRSCQITIQPGQLIGVSMNFLGKSFTQSTASGAGTPVAPGTVAVLNAIDNVVAIYETQNGVAETWKVASLTLNVENDLGPRLAIGNVGPVSIRQGRGAVTGSMRIFLEHGSSETSGIKDMIDSYTAGTARSDSPGYLGIVLYDSAQSAYMVLNVNKAFLSSARTPIGGVNEDMFLDIDFQAQASSTATNGPSGTGTAFTMHRLS